jgi:hypothetical protein
VGSFCAFDVPGCPRSRADRRGFVLRIRPSAPAQSVRVFVHPATLQLLLLSDALRDSCIVGATFVADLGSRTQNA